MNLTTVNFQQNLLTVIDIKTALANQFKKNKKINIWSGKNAE